MQKSSKRKLILNKKIVFELQSNYLRILKGGTVLDTDVQKGCLSFGQCDLTTEKKYSCTCPSNNLNKTYPTQ